MAVGMNDLLQHLQEAWISESLLSPPVLLCDSFNGFLAFLFSLVLFFLVVPTTKISIEK